MRTRLVWGGVCLGGMILAVTAGCRQHPPQAPTSSKPAVPVSKPVSREVTEYAEYTGRTDAVSSVGIRARVTGYLVRSPFKEGDFVKGPVKLFGVTVREGDLLFEIDPRPYKAQLDQAVSQVEVTQAQEKLAKANYARSKDSFDKGVNSKQDVDTNTASVEEAASRIAAAQASVKLYELNLGFCQVRSPINGQVSRYYYTLGNLIMQDQTLLSTVVSIDPMYAYFDLDERTLLRIRTAINQGKIRARGPGTALPVQMGLEGETGFPHEGVVDFVNNVVNPSTGTLALRGVFANPLPAVVEMALSAAHFMSGEIGPGVSRFVRAEALLPSGGRRLLSPGMFVRIRLPIGQPHPALLVVDRALGSDQGQKYAYVVDADNKIQYRKVTAGALQDDGLRVIEDGLKPDDRVVVGALQQLKPGMEVEPDTVAMPTPGAPEPPGNTK